MSPVTEATRSPSREAPTYCVVWVYMRPSWMKKPIMSAAMPASGASGMGSGGIYTGSKGSAGTKTPLPAVAADEAAGALSAGLVSLASRGCQTMSAIAAQAARAAAPAITRRRDFRGAAASSMRPSDMPPAALKMSLFVTKAPPFRGMREASPSCGAEASARPARSANCGGRSRVWRRTRSSAGQRRGAPSGPGL